MSTYRPEADIAPGPALRLDAPLIFSDVMAASAVRESRGTSKGDFAPGSAANVSGSLPPFSLDASRSASRDMGSKFAIGEIGGIGKNKSFPLLSGALPADFREKIAGGQTVNITDGFNDSSTQPDYLLRLDPEDPTKFQLVENPERGPDDGKIDIELQEKIKDKEQLKKINSMLELAAIEDEIRYWQMSNPGKDPPMHLLNRQALIQSSMSESSPLASTDNQQQPFSVSPPLSSREQLSSSLPTVESPRSNPISYLGAGSGAYSGGGAGGYSGGGSGGYSGGGGGGGGRPYFSGDGSGYSSSDGGYFGGDGDIQLNQSMPRAMQIMDYFVEKGLTPEQSAGIVGNMQRESGLNPGIQEYGSGIGFGLVQWSFDRRNQLEDFAAGRGRPVSDMTTQLDFIWKELNTTERATLDAFRANPNMSAGEAAMVFSQKYERPGVVAMDERVDAAEYFHRQYQNGGGEQGATKIGPPPPTEFNNRLVQAVLEVDAAMAGTGRCAAAVQYALGAAGLPEFMGTGNGWEMANNLLMSGKFERISAAEAQPGDIIGREWSNSEKARNGGADYGDISVITQRNNNMIIQSNDATYQYRPNNPMYQRDIFLRYTGDSRTV